MKNPIKVEAIQFTSKGDAIAQEGDHIIKGDQGVTFIHAICPFWDKHIRSMIYLEESGNALSFTYLL